MTTEQITQKIVAETTSLMPLKVDNAEVIKRIFKSISGQVSALNQSANNQKDTYQKAAAIAEKALNEEYVLFDTVTLHDEKEQALIQLKHRAAEVCELVQAA